MQSEVRKTSSTRRLTGSRRVGSFHLPAITAFLILLFGTVGMVVAQSSGGSSSGGSTSGSSSGSSGTSGTSSTSGAGASGTSSTGSTASSSQSWTSVQSALKFNGKVEANGVFKAEFSRQDGPFQEDGFNRNPQYFAEGYLAFYRPGTFSGSNGAAGSNGAGSTGSSSGTSSSTGATGTSGATAGSSDNVFVAGEIPLRENEVSKFEQALERANIWIPAIHNHEIQETPRLIFVHVETVGSSHQIASAIRRAMDQTRGKFKEDEARQISTPSVSGLANIPSAIGYNATLQEDNGVLTVIVPRQEDLTDCAIAITQSDNGGTSTGTSGGTSTGTSGTSGTSGSGTANTGTSGSGSTSTGTSGTGTNATTGSGTSTSGTASTGTGASGSASANSGASSVGMSSNAGMTSNNCLLESLQAQPGMSSGSTTGNSGSGTANTGTSGSGSTSTGTTGTGTNTTTGAGTSASGTGTTGMSASMNRIPPEVGAVSEFRFEMGGNGSVDVDAEFALLATEAPQTLRLLRENGFVVSALHNHFAFESPRLLFLHASGQGSAAKLAQVIRMALDQNAALSGTGSNATGTSGSTSGTSSTSSPGPGF